MSQSAVLRQPRMHSEPNTTAPAQPAVEVDPGPWLFLAAPLAFAITLFAICWSSLITF